MALTDEEKAFLIKIGQVVPDEVKTIIKKQEPTTEKDEA